MEDIVKELVKLNQRDLLDIVAVLVPIFLSVIIIVQNKIYEHRNTELQKRIHNREWSQQYHDDILLVYNTYYEFCDVIFNSLRFMSNICKMVFLYIISSRQRSQV